MSRPKLARLATTVAITSARNRCADCRYDRSPAKASIGQRPGRRSQRKSPASRATACSIPAGMADDLPVGMQIIGRRYADGDVFAASAAFEQLRPWADRYRVCADRSLAHAV